MSGSLLALGMNNVTLSGSTPATFAGVISGSGGVTLDATSTQTLSGNNTFTGGVSLDGATLSVPTVANIGTAQPLARAPPRSPSPPPPPLRSPALEAPAGADAVGHPETSARWPTVAMSGTSPAGIPPPPSTRPRGRAPSIIPARGRGTAICSLRTGPLRSPERRALRARRRWDWSTNPVRNQLSAHHLQRGVGQHLQPGRRRLLGRAVAGGRSARTPSPRPGAFDWGAGTIATLGNNTMGSQDRTDPLGSPSGPVVMEGRSLNYAGSLASSTTPGKPPPWTLAPPSSTNRASLQPDPDLPGA